MLPLDTNIRQNGVERCQWQRKTSVNAGPAHLPKNTNQCQVAQAPLTHMHK